MTAVPFRTCRSPPCAHPCAVDASLGYGLAPGTPGTGSHGAAPTAEGRRTSRRPISLPQAPVAGRPAPGTKRRPHGRRVAGASAEPRRQGMKGRPFRGSRGGDHGLGPPVRGGREGPGPCLRARRRPGGRRRAGPPRSSARRPLRAGTGRFTDRPRADLASRCQGTIGGPPARGVPSPASRSCGCRHPRRQAARRGGSRPGVRRARGAGPVPGSMQGHRTTERHRTCHQHRSGRARDPSAGVGPARRRYPWRTGIEGPGRHLKAWMVGKAYA